jgi:hypothetical protein
MKKELAEITTGLISINTFPKILLAARLPRLIVHWSSLILMSHGAELYPLLLLLPSSSPSSFLSSFPNFLYLKTR